ncbi:TolC family protein [Caminibacter pacificus]|uniref:Outer membrane protein TolC n=1 Tax=Caminibacter pacificus TaxID=1424653 RepID=A0AAJ4UXB7_9BACT|nr:TolC family protein [Caminibacter pacificus]QCI29013.1 TolC family protein [Caminibacter pacificus]ROR39178.1 outer membrane protein TolC [Caminibacter pacificus]
MKKVSLVLIATGILWAENFTQIKNEITNSLSYKLAQKKVQIYEKKLKAVKAKNYGSLDFEYNAVHFFNQPEMKLTSPQPVAVAPDGIHLIYQDVKATLPMADKNHFIGEIKYSYPLFTGFGISNLIKKSELELIKQKLELKNVKRELILNAAKLYSSIYALKCNINALKFAKNALNTAREKADALYKEGLINKSSVDEINAKYYEVIADIKNLKSQKESLLNMLSYLLNKKIDKIDGIIVKKINFSPDFQKRPDVRAIKETLKISDVDIKLAKSKLYPQIGFVAGLKREADNLILTKNDYQNIDKSYLGIGIKYNIYNGGATKNEIEMAKIAKASALIYYKNYLNKVKTDYQNDLANYKALFFRLKAAKEEVKARESYYEYIKAKFNEGLADSSDLNDAIAKLAAAKAKRDAIKAQIFFLGVKLRYDGGENE